MPSSAPVVTSACANSSAQIRITTAANTNIATMVARRARVENVPR